MSIERLQSYYGFTRMPFGRGLAPAMLHRPPGHAEAVARISWCVDQHAIGVITGEVGAGKTVAIRAATAALDPARHVIIYLPNPSVGVRGMLHHIVTALGRVPSFYTATLAPQAADALAAEHAERGRSWSSMKLTCSTTRKWKPSACSPTTTWTAGHRSPRCWSDNPPCVNDYAWACWPHSINASPCAMPWPG